MDNLRRHVSNVQKFGIPAVVCINKFLTDTDAEVQALMHGAEAQGATCVLGEHWAKGGEGCEELAHSVVAALDMPSTFKPLYADDISIEKKLTTIASEIYGADAVHFTDEARTQLLDLSRNERACRFPVCV